MIDLIGRWMAVCLITGFLGIAGQALAGTASAVIDKTEGSVSDTFYVTLTINGKVKGSINPPSIDGCESAQAGVSHNMQWINGEFSSEDQYTFVIQPRRGGTFTVPSWKLKVDGEDVSTLPLRFTVTGAGSGPAPGPGNVNPPAGSGGGNSQPSSPDESAPQLGDEIYIERDVPDRPPYVGEAFISTVRVFHKIQITSAAPKRDSSPEFRLIAVPGDKTYQRVVGGVRYQVIEFKETLIPLRAGTHTLPPYRLQATVMRPLQKMPGGSVFDFFSNQFFGGHRGLGNLFGREETVEVRGKPVKVTVRDLPADGHPAGFSGLVGQFSLRADVASRQIAPGESATATVVVEGEGALDTLDRLPDVLGDQTGRYKVYPEKPTLKEEFSTTPEGVTALRSRREFKYAVVVRGQGQNGSQGGSQNNSQSFASRIELGRVSVPYFNPASGKYEAMEADFGSVDVMENAGSMSGQVPPASGTASRGETPGVNKPERKLPPGLITLLLAVAAAGVAGVLWRRRNQWMIRWTTRDARPAGQVTLVADVPRVSMSRATSATLVAETRRLVESDKLPEALACLEHALREVISSHVGKRVDAMTPREIRSLAHPSHDVKKVLDLLERVEALVFSQSPVTRDEVLALVAQITGQPEVDRADGTARNGEEK
jgi:hypothetical protein